MTGTEDSSFIPSTPTSKKDKRRTRNKCLRFLRRRWVIYGLLASVVLAFILIVVLAALLGAKGFKGHPRKITVTKGAVVSDHEVCSRIGRDVLTEGGSAVDSSIATLLCDGILAPHSMGIGGGCFMVIYDAKEKKTLVIDGRETAPLGSSQETFNNVSGYHGSKFIGVPGEIAAYWKAHQRFGKLQWKRLFDPSIHLLENGFHVSHSVARALNVVKSSGENVCDYMGLGDIFCDSDGNFLTQGSFVKWPKMAETYKNIADKGPEYLYKGKVAETLAQEIQAKGGVIQKEDFESYSVKESSGIEFDFDDMTLLTHGAPSGGPVMGLVMKILEGVGINADSLKDTKSEALAMHKMIEAIKLAYGERAKLGDEDFVPRAKEAVKRMMSDKLAEYLRGKIDLTKTHNISYYANVTEAAHDAGTSHVSVLDAEGNAVSVTSTINTYFGSLVVSESTGIIWNNEMADFSLYNTKDNLDKLVSTLPNRVEPGKRPLSSMAPAIFIDKNSGSVRMVLGNAGGSKIITTNIQVALRYLWMAQDVEEAVRAKRLHHQLDPNHLVYEFGYPQDILDELKNYGHELKYQSTYMSVVQAITRNPRTGEIAGFSDERKIPGKAMFHTIEEDVYV